MYFLNSDKHNNKHTLYYWEEKTNRLEKACINEAFGGDNLEV